MFRTGSSTRGGIDDPDLRKPSLGCCGPIPSPRRRIEDHFPRRPDYREVRRTYIRDSTPATPASTRSSPLAVVRPRGAAARGGLPPIRRRDAHPRPRPGRGTEWPANRSVPGWCWIFPGFFAASSASRARPCGCSWAWSTNGSTPNCGLVADASSDPTRPTRRRHHRRQHDRASDASGSRWLTDGSVRRHLPALAKSPWPTASCVFDRPPPLRAASEDPNPRPDLVNRLTELTSFLSAGINPIVR